MKWFLLLTLGGTGVVIVTLCLIVLLVMHRLRRRNRVRPTRPDDVPLFWLLSPQLAARLHRRLVAATRAVQLVAERHRPAGRRARRHEPPTIVALCDQLEAHAASLDANLTYAVRLSPGPRRHVLANLAQGVAELERTAVRISVMSAQMSCRTVLSDHVGGITELSSRLDALEQADASLRELEAGAGLITPSVLYVESEPAAASAAEGRTGSR